MTVSSIPQQCGKTRGNISQKEKFRVDNGEHCGKITLYSIMAMREKSYRRPPGARRGQCKPVGIGTVTAAFEPAVMNGTGCSRYRALRGRLAAKSGWYRGSDFRPCLLWQTGAFFVAGGGRCTIRSSTWKKTHAAGNSPSSGPCSIPLPALPWRWTLPT